MLMFDQYKDVLTKQQIICVKLELFIKAGKMEF